MKLGLFLPCALAVGALAMTAPRDARADATAEQRAAAQALFDDARRLIGEQRWADACPKLEESQRLDPGIGTLLNLAECQSQIGKTASAWANYLEAAYQAKAAGQTKREGTARARAAALEPRLSKLTIIAVIAGTAVEIRRDGNAVAASLVGTAVPVDPGVHVVSASASGKKPWSTEVTVRPEGHQVTVSVPQLEEADRSAPLAHDAKLAVTPEAPKLALPPEEPPPSGPPPHLDTGRGPRASGAVLLTLGIAGLGVGAVFTGLAVLKNNDSNSGVNPHCQGNVCPGPPGGNSPYDVRNEARTYGNVATAGWIAGGVLGAGGVGLLIAASVIKAKQVALTPTLVVAGRAGTTFGAAWRF